MAYKRGQLNHNNVVETTKAYFSNETINKAAEKVEEIEEKKKRKQYEKHFTIEGKENKTHTVSLRLTDKEFNDLIAKVEKNRCSVSNYIKQLIAKGK